MDVRRVAVAGTGLMGPGIAATFALAGCEAVMVSRTAENAAKGVAHPPHHSAIPGLPSR